MRKNIKKVAKIGVSGLLAAGLLVGSVEYASHMFVMTNKAVAKQVNKVTEEVKTNSKSGLDSEDVSKQETVYATLDAMVIKQTLSYLTGLKMQQIREK